MKNLKETFVIVKNFSNGTSGFFENYVSFDKNELDQKCKELNEKTQLIDCFSVLSLEDAIKKFMDNIADFYTEQTADY